jgi:phosphatidate cytidylyltransferase
MRFRQKNMRELYVRTLTALLLITLVTSAYKYCAPCGFALLFACAGFYAVLCEYIALCRASSYQFLIFLPAITIPFILLTIWAAHSATQYLVALTLLLSASADTGAYMVGKLWGAHLLAPQISPKKTIEGFLGGCVTTAAVAAFLYYLFGNCVVWNYTLQPFLFFTTFGFGVALCGLWGDLSISLLKRQAHIKDISNLLPGHGGLLDRFDSILAVTIYIWLHKTTLTLLYG